MALSVALIGVLAMRYQLPIEHIVFRLILIPIVGLLIAKRSMVGSIQDIVFGVIDTGLLTILAFLGGILFGVVGPLLAV